MHALRSDLTDLYEHWRSADIAAHHAENFLFAARLLDVSGGRPLDPAFVSTAAAMRTHAEVMRRIFVDQAGHEPDAWV